MENFYKTIFFVIVMSGTALAFGSTTKGSSVTIDENSTAVFSLLFWSDDNQTVELNVISKNNFEVDMQRKIQIGPAEGGEMVYAAGKYIRATPVLVEARDVPRGFHSIVISAKVYSQGNQITLVQERLFNLTVIAGNLAEKNVQVVANEPKETTGYVYVPVIFVAILIVAFAIYKYS